MVRFGIIKQRWKKYMMIWDNIWDFSHYNVTKVKVEIITYNICNGGCKQ